MNVLPPLPCCFPGMQEQLMTSVAEASSASAAATELRGELGAAQQLLKEQQAVVAEAQQLVRSAAAAAVAQQKMRQKLEAELAGKQQKQLEELQAQLEEAAQEVWAGDTGWGSVGMPRWLADWLTG